MAATVIRPFHLRRVAMNENREQAQPKKAWSALVVTVYGNVEELTHQGKSKQPGSKDDFNVNGISNFP